MAFLSGLNRLNPFLSSLTTISQSPLAPSKNPVSCLPSHPFNASFHYHSDLIPPSPSSTPKAFTICTDHVISQLIPKSHNELLRRQHPQPQSPSPSPLAPHPPPSSSQPSQHTPTHENPLQGIPRTHCTCPRIQPHTLTQGAFAAQDGAHEEHRRGTTIWQRHRSRGSMAPRTRAGVVQHPGHSRPHRMEPMDQPGHVRPRLDGGRARRSTAASKHGDSTCRVQGQLLWRRGGVSVEGRHRS